MRSLIDNGVAQGREIEGLADSAIRRHTAYSISDRRQLDDPPATNRLDYSSTFDRDRALVARALGSDLGGCGLIDVESRRAAIAGAQSFPLDWRAAD